MLLTVLRRITPQLTTVKRTLASRGWISTYPKPSGCGPSHSRRFGTKQCIQDAIKRNKQIIACGKENDWKGILVLFDKLSKDFNNINFATTISQLGRIKALNKDDTTFLRLVDTTVAKIEQNGINWIGARQLANVAHALGKMKLQQRSAVRDFFTLLNQESFVTHLFNEGNPQEIGNTAWACATLGVQAPQLFAEIETRAPWLVKEGTPQEISNTAWACAALGVQAPQLLAEIETRAAWLVTEGTSQAIANTAWAFATLGVQAPQLFSEIETCAARLVNEGKPQEIANTAWACATLGVQAPQLFAEIEARAPWLVKEGKPQEIANTVWAFATFGVQAPQLLAEIEKRALWLVKEGSPQNVSNTAWACAKLGVQAPRLFAEIETRALWLVKEGCPQNISNTAWACAKLGVQVPRLFAEIAEIETRSAWLVKEGTPQEIANTAWACAKLGLQCPRLFAEIENRAAWFTKEGTPQNIANTAWACATLGLLCPRLFSEIETRAAFLAEEGTPQDIANTAWACAIVGQQCSLVNIVLSTRLDWMLEEANEQCLVNVCYAIAILDLATGQEDQFRNFWQRMMLLVVVDRLPEEEVGQLVQSFVFVAAAGIEGLAPPKVRGRSTRVGKQSRSQTGLSSFLADRIGYKHETEVSPFAPGDSRRPFLDDMLAIDIANRDGMVAIEFDGPSHFLKEAGSGKVLRVENGPTKAKRLFLQRIGWTVVNIPFFQWMEAKDDKHKHHFLAAKFSELKVAK